MKNYGIYTILLILSSVLTAFSLYAKDTEPDPYKGFDEATYMDMDLDENINTPKVGTIGRDAIKRYMNSLGNSFAKRGYTVDMTRDDEVLLITIPTDNLFLPNDTLLLPGAPSILSPIVGQLTDPMMFKLVYSVHTDDTGSRKYNLALSHARNISIYEWLLDNINQDLIVIPYELGDTDPVVPNDSRAGRKENRRIELYLIPGPKMIELARKDRLR